MTPDSRRRVVDALARRAITGGGLIIIASILAMLVFLVEQTLPLWGRAEFESVAARPGSSIGPNGPAPILSTTAFREVVFAASPEGKVVGSVSDAPAEVLASAGSPIVASAPASIDGRHWVVASDLGTLSLVSVDDGLKFSSKGRVYRPRATIDSLVTFERGGVRTLGAAPSSNGWVFAAATPDELHIVRVTERETPLGEIRRRTRTHVLPVAAPETVTSVAFDDGAVHVVIGRSDGRLEVWPSARGASAPVIDTELFSGAGVSVVTALLGRTTIVVGSDDGRVEAWFLALDTETNERRWIRSNAFERHRHPVAGVSPSTRDKTFVTWDESGELALHFATSGETRARTALDGPGPYRVALAPKADACLVSNAAGDIASIDVHNPHPEVTGRTLFGKVHYEGYVEPSYAWQSTGATDETEPKLSLIPLIFGTLKGTFYALVFSIPIAVLAAMYTALFMRPNLRALVKPSMELMAAMPSVVLGLLAALWLAPRLQSVMPIALLVPAYLTAVFVGSAAVWRGLPAGARQRTPAGMEAFVLVPVIVASLLVVFRANGWVDGWFDGGFLSWLFERHEMRYDQRNAIIVGLAMGLAVIPIIFSISEDALAAVPRHLTAGSLALGASPWQTAWRVVLPAASPGIFSAVMIGFGRAVGETMIVLMATGNTPIMDWSLFNGFRTLSANIAVEIPEAPHGGSLYRLLFLAALLLFAVTFVVNTLAEVVRDRLRRRYSRF